MIQVRIRSSIGAQWDGVLLWLRGRVMRVALRDYADVAELHCHDGQWFAEDGDAVEIAVHAIADHPSDPLVPLSDPVDCLPRTDPPWVN